MYTNTGFNYTSLGCYLDKEKGSRAIPSLEGKSELLDGKYRRRKNAIEKCAELAYSLNFTVFAISRGGECLSSESANETYFLYGNSSNCGANGKGGLKPRTMMVLHADAYGLFCSFSACIG